MGLNFRKVNGITLISLIITVVVMLILAGIAIGSIAGEEEMFSKVSDATKEYKKQSLIELIRSAEIELELDIELSKNTERPLEKNIENLMNKIVEIGKLTDKEYEVTWENEENTGTIIDKKTGVVLDITIDENGNIIIEGSIVDEL